MQSLVALWLLHLCQTTPEQRQIKLNLLNPQAYILGTYVFRNTRIWYNLFVYFFDKCDTFLHVHVALNLLDGTAVYWTVLTNGSATTSVLAFGSKVCIRLSLHVSASRKVYMLHETTYWEHSTVESQRVLFIIKISGKIWALRDIRIACSQSAAYRQQRVSRMFYTRRSIQWPSRLCSG